VGVAKKRLTLLPTTPHGILAGIHLSVRPKRLVLLLLGRQATGQVRQPPTGHLVLQVEVQTRLLVTALQKLLLGTLHLVIHIGQPIEAQQEVLPKTLPVPPREARQKAQQ
jgi:hypothetical protein